VLTQLWSWAQRLAAGHGVNPVVFAVLYLACLAPWYASLAVVLEEVERGIASSHWRLRNLVVAGSVLAVSSVLPYLYVAFWGTGLPWYVWVVGAGLILTTLVLLWRRITHVRAASAGSRSENVSVRPSVDEGRGYRTRKATMAREARTMSEHKGEEMKGRLKEAVGDVTGDKNLQREGKIDEASAVTKKTIEDAADKVKDVIDPKP
jgi:uncharacterized protein YjbJ (UPF0337 family)